ncbi:MAG: LysR family transcriptional regulator [Proteobacteria bacterium]|nr:LysR family transcriptional regulator [Pseudomonadota bacterium]
MIDKLELLLHLARERHFGKAAQAAGVSQPTLSAAVKSLEEQLGVTIVERGSRFRSFTAEGERVLGWARQLTADVRAMRSELHASSRNLAGKLRLGIIPTALPALTALTVPFRDAHAAVQFRVTSLTSNQILDKMTNLELDIGISYIDSEPLGQFRGVPLYEERYALLVTAGNPFADRASIGWREAGNLPLCQLTGDMQNRRLIDRHLREAGAEAECTVESNSMLILYDHVRTGRWASIMPVRFAEQFDEPGHLRAIPLVEPDVRHMVGFILPGRDTQTPLVARFVEASQKAFAA